MFGISFLCFNTKTRKTQLFLIICMVLVFITSNISKAHAAPLIEILKEEVPQGIVKVALDSKVQGIKVMVEKEEEKYYYDLKNHEDSFPLQLGNGQYTIRVLENTTGNKYRILKSEIIQAQMLEQNKVFLGSAQPIIWNNNMNAIKLAQSLIKDKDQNEAIKAIYDYVVNNIKYDDNKINYLANDYVPEIDLIFKEKSGICYDYAALFAAMLRGVGVPAKLVKGYKNDIKEYHAWNEVYLDGKWLVIDTTYDAAWAPKGWTSYNMIKDETLYDKKREY